MMDLALHLGATAGDLSRSLTEAEFQRWLTYANTFGLPLRRLELMLAQLTAVVARSFGGAKSIEVRDFMLRDAPIAEDMPDNVTRMEAARAAFGFRPRKGRK